MGQLLGLVVAEAQVVRAHEPGLPEHGVQVRLWANVAGGGGEHVADHPESLPGTVRPGDVLLHVFSDLRADHVRHAPEARPRRVSCKRWATAHR